MKTIPVILKHYFRDSEGNRIASFGETKRAAREQIGNPDNWNYESTEEIQYEHAPVAVALAELLPGHWEAIPQSDEYPNCNWNLRRSDGLTLFLSGPCYNHKTAYKVGLSTPRHKGSYVEAYDGNQRVASPTIGIGADKAIEKKAADIVRRLLTEAERVNALVVARIAEMEANEDAQQSSYKAICAAFGITPNDPHGSDRPAGSFDGGGFEVQYGGKISFSLYSVEPAKAIQLAQAIKAIL